MKIKLHTCELIKATPDEGGYRGNPYIHYIDNLEADRVVVKAGGLTQIQLKNGERKNYQPEEIIEIIIEG